MQYIRQTIETFLNLFSKEKALYLVDNPAKIGFSWWFFFAGIAAGYWVNKCFGDSRFVVEVVPKLLIITILLPLGLIRNQIAKRVRTGKTSKDSAMLYLIPLCGYAISFWISMSFGHMVLAIFN